MTLKNPYVSYNDILHNIPLIYNLQLLHKHFRYSDVFWRSGRGCCRVVYHCSLSSAPSISARLNICFQRTVEHCCAHLQRHAAASSRKHARSVTLNITTRIAGSGTDCANARKPPSGVVVFFFLTHMDSSASSFNLWCMHFICRRLSRSCYVTN